MSSPQRPKRIALVGGTHGNEKGGVWLVRHALAHPELFQRTGLEVQWFLANTRAEERNLRYIDRDLNRCFGPQLAHAHPDSPEWERRRADELRHQLQAQDGFDLIVDLHNTTANMDATWILTDTSPWAWWLAFRAHERDPSLVHVLHTPESPETNVFLPSLGAAEITLEIGPAPHGTHDHRAWRIAEDQVRNLLDDLQACPVDFDPLQELSKIDFEYFRSEASVDYPRDDHGAPTALIHEKFHGRDFQPLAQGEPVFFDPFTGRTLSHTGPTIWPVFVGEAAYVEKGIAYTPTCRHAFAGGQGVFS